STRGYLSAIRGKLWWTLSFLLLIVAYGAFLLTRNTILFFGVRPVRDYVEHLREALERGGPLRKMEATGEPGLDALSEQINSLVSRMRDTQLREISQLKELRFVQRLSESLLRVTSRRDLAQVLVDELHRAIGKGAVVLRLLRSDRTALECVAHTGIPDDLIEETWVLPVGKGLAGRVVLAEAPVLIEDYNNAGLRASDRPSPFYYAYCAPIRSGSETIGTLSVLTPEQFPITQSMRRTLDIATQEFGVVYRGLTAVLRLRELKDFNDQILENMSEGIVVESSDGTIEYVNPFLLRLLGVRTRSAVIGKRLDQWMKSSERASADRVPQIPADALASYETYILPEGNTAKRAVRVTSTYLSGEGNYPRRLSVVTDITEIKEREALIERNRQFLLTLTNAIPAAIVVLGRGGEIIFYNSTFRQAFVTGGSDSITGTVDPVLASKLDEVLRQGASIVGQEFEQEPGPRNPRKRYWRLSAIHMPERDEVLCVLVDVSDERELARKIAETEKLIVLGEMVTRVSHQINNPLTGVIGNAELLLSEFPEGTEPYEMATLILHSADRIRKVLASLEMFIRKPFETGSTFSLNTLVTDAVTLFERSLGRRGIQLETVLDPALPQIRGDPFQVRQALINLITNSDQAYEEARKGGIIRVQTRWLPDTREALLVVQDWATGMSEVVKARALEPFFTTRSTDQNATGMGLPVAYGIVRAHGGSMQIESEVGQGTTVSLRFPVPLHLESETPTGQDVPFVRTDTLENLRILLVEDEVEVVLPLKRFLESERAIVEMARSGQEALNCVASRDYDAILLDLHLPDCHGLEIIEHLSTTHPGLLRGVLVITGLVLEAREEECLNHKRIPTLRKPFSMTDLKRAILVRLYGDLAQPSSA
ncbi:MAG: ATP-binding protein, partial [bacterium JZ-2024 1]